MISSDQLRDFSIISHLDQDFIEKLAGACDLITIEPDEWIFHEGEPADYLYLVLGGAVDLKLRIGERRAAFTTLNTLRHGDPLGWSALVEPYTYRLSAITQDTTELIRMDGVAVRQIIEEHPDQGFHIMKVVAQGVSTRVATLSEHVPGVSPRLIASTLLGIFGAVWGVMAIAFLLSVIYAASKDGYDEDLTTLFMCLLMPIFLLGLAYWLYPHGEEQNQVAESS